MKICVSLWAVYLPNSMKTLWTLCLAVACTPFVDLRAENMKSVDDFQSAAAKANAVLTIPEWEQTPEAVTNGMQTAIDKANKALDAIDQNFREVLNLLQLLKDPATGTAAISIDEDGFVWLEIASNSKGSS